MTTRRRTLAFTLTATTLALSAGLLPGAMARAQVPPELELARALARAQELGLPLVVVVVPREDDARQARAERLGDFFLRGPRDALALLGLAELVCATSEEVRSLFPEVSEAEPFIYFLASRAGAHLQAFDTATPMSELPGLSRHDGFEAMANVVRRALAHLGSALLDENAAERAYARFEERYLEQAIPGSRWGEQHWCPPCGMGGASHASVRFLDLFARVGEHGGRGE